MIQINTKPFGTLSCGKTSTLWTVNNGAMSFSACDYGCLLTSILLPSRSGTWDDITLGFSTFDGFAHRNSRYFGALVGRCANRIANATFSLDEKTYQLDANYGPHYLHGGFTGYHQMMWQGEELRESAGAGVRFTRRSPSGEQGFPGNMELEVVYLLNEQNELILRYRAQTDAPTPLSLTNHVYLNLRGEGYPSVNEHILKINSSRRLEVDNWFVPTGRILNASGTVFDFSTPMPLGKHADAPELKVTRGGYDTAYCFDPVPQGAPLPLLAEISEPVTTRTLRCWSNQPCMQLYTSCNLDLKEGKKGHSYPPLSGFCLETQQYTNAVQIPAFPSPILRPGERRESLTHYSFSWDF